MEPSTSKSSLINFPQDYYRGPSYLLRSCSDYPVLGVSYVPLGDIPAPNISFCSCYLMVPI